ncbi:MAG TPA: universal stress protein [Burkholderiaceae bacterium]|nr:universal stress protein [Burkholderiaceae bacterium]
MNPIDTILVATDFSPDGHNAVRRAALLARQLDAHLSLLHVVDSAGFKPFGEWLARPIDIDFKAARARAALRELCAEIATQHDVTATREVRVGDPHEELLRASAKADLLVIGPRGRKPWKTVMVGGTAERMLHNSRTPVLVVKRKADAPYQRVLVPVDLTPHSDTVVQAGASLAPSADIEVFHAIESAREAVLHEAGVPRAILREARAQDETRVNARMRRSVARLGLDGRRVNFSLTYGHPVPSTMRMLQAAGADLVVVGPGGASAGIRFLLGSVSQRLLTLTDCDTVIVPRTTRTAIVARASPFARAAQSPAGPQPWSGA